MVRRISWCDEYLIVAVIYSTAENMLAVVENKSYMPMLQEIANVLRNLCRDQVPLTNARMRTWLLQRGSSVAPRRPAAGPSTTNYWWRGKNFELLVQQRRSLYLQVSGKFTRPAPQRGKCGLY